MQRAKLQCIWQLIYFIKFLKGILFVECLLSCTLSNAYSNIVIPTHMLIMDLLNL